MTPELNKLRSWLEDNEDVAETIELELVDDPKWTEPSDTSYLTAEDRKNDDIMANTEAMTKTNELIAWFGRDSEGFVGLWCGSSNGPLEGAPVVRLDSEGQYHFEGATVADYIALAVHGSDEDEFEDVRDNLAEAGFRVGDDIDAIYSAIDALKDPPNDYRNKLYNQNRVARGLKPV